ncbi:O-succinylhomoserine sulfhydrylase [Novimethylophilus kurashikiensis]|uniref:O-succinylhomoserine sulfhydrylase n=1 Tax=Novimethylophilus kurashikiensis TaxID=1825523 RepID=A0A2R5F6E2_9PROT|nr:PLP-dependent aspartate aminotransferase family protein [Novimethylophilus kurashikiensis]GBG13449.1 O-succinylhomoserine sulfhydrylase [Novimethylophilus kurashikiensis]
MAKDGKGTATRMIHGGAIKDALGSPHLPLYDTTTFKFDTTRQLLDVVEGHREGFLYTRYGANPTIQDLEAKLASLDDAEAALVFSSGMAALSALFLAHGRRGIVCIGDAYGGTLELLSEQLPGLGFSTYQLFASDLQQLEQLLADGVGMVFFETPTNPRLELLDIEKIATMAHAHGALVAVDNTFATPINQQPLKLGADIVMQSATKYLGGHSDLTGGVLAATRALLAPVRPWRKNLGQMLAPETAHKLSRSLATLTLRVERHNANALAIARFLQAHPSITRVYYPGLPDSPDYALAARQMRGFGGMVTFEVDSTKRDAGEVVERFKIISLAPSLGGVESLVTQPVTTSHHDMSEEERARRGISESMVRLSVGLEDVVDLIADLEQALA